MRLIPLHSLKCLVVISTGSHFQLTLQPNQRGFCTGRRKYSRQQVFIFLKGARAICLAGSSWKRSTKKVLNRITYTLERFNTTATSWSKLLKCLKKRSPLPCCHLRSNLVAAAVKAESLYLVHFLNPALHFHDLCTQRSLSGSLTSQTDGKLQEKGLYARLQFPVTETLSSIRNEDVSEPRSALD